MRLEIDRSYNVEIVGEEKIKKKNYNLVRIGAVVEDLKSRWRRGRLRDGSG